MDTQASSVPAQGGPWGADEHRETLRQNALERRVLQFVLALSNAKTLVDFGCGPGSYVKLACDQGVDAWGVEPVDLAPVFQAPGRQILQDITRPLDLGRRFDLVVCLEVAEHVPREHEATLLDNLIRHAADVVLFSAAHPGQPGLGHVNLRPEEHWLQAFGYRGLHRQCEETQICRRLSHLPWMRSNLIVLARDPHRFRARELDRLKVEHLLSGTAGMADELARVGNENTLLFNALYAPGANSRGARHWLARRLVKLAHVVRPKTSMEAGAPPPTADQAASRATAASSPGEATVPESAVARRCPKVAIITRTKNRPHFLRRAGRSVQDQTHRDFVWIVVDDAGDDPAEVERIVAASDVPSDQIVVIHRPESRGMEAASNEGLRSSHSEYVVIHDDDDSWEPSFLAKCTSFLDAQPSFAGIVSRTNVVTEQVNGREIRRVDASDYSSHFRIYWSVPTLIQMLAVNLFPPISFLYRRAVLETLGGYDETLPVLGDWDFNVRFLARYDVGVVDELLANYHLRVAPKNLYDGNSQTTAQHQHVLYDALLRNRWAREGIPVAEGANMASQGGIMRTQLTLLNYVADVKYILEHQRVDRREVVLSDSIRDNLQLAVAATYNLGRLVFRKLRGRR